MLFFLKSEILNLTKRNVMKGEEIDLKCPNCYNPVYKEEIVCVECGLQLLKGVGKRKTLIQQINFWIKWILIIMLISIMCYFFFIILLANYQHRMLTLLPLLKANSSPHFIYSLIQLSYGCL
jgi:ribosomal protein S27E